MKNTRESLDVRIHDESSQDWKYFRVTYSLNVDILIY